MFHYFTVNQQCTRIIIFIRKRNRSINDHAEKNKYIHFTKKNVVMGPYALAVVDYNPPYVDARVDSNKFTIDNPMSESTLILCCQIRLYPPYQGLKICWPQKTKFAGVNVSVNL
jgi:hypothetical protein